MTMLLDFGGNFREQLGYGVPSRYLIVPYELQHRGSINWYLQKRYRAARNINSSWVWVKNRDCVFHEQLTDAELQELTFNLLAATTLR